MAEFPRLQREAGAYRDLMMGIDDFTEAQLLTRFRFDRSGIEVSSPSILPTPTNLPS